MAGKALGASTLAVACLACLGVAAWQAAGLQSSAEAEVSTLAGAIALAKQQRVSGDPRQRPHAA